jgi:hypothetical protein
MSTELSLVTAGNRVEIIRQDRDLSVIEFNATLLGGQEKLMK